MAAKDSGPEGSQLFKIHWREFSEGYLTSADAAIALVLEEAARRAEGFPADYHGHLATTSRAASVQTADEIAAAIRAMKGNP